MPIRPVFRPIVANKSRMSQQLLPLKSFFEDRTEGGDE